MRKGAVLALLSFLFFAIAILFWHNEWIYSLPTPIPDGYKPVAKGNLIQVNGLQRKNAKPLFLHFFNPDCPCSKFNTPHFRSLVKRYNDKVDFAVVVMTEDEDYTVDKIRDKLNIDVPVLFDTALATRCGVYSTPQAVILTAEQQLFYRGNYNRSRYCTDKKTNYAQIALDSLLGNNYNIHFNQFALQAYGCSLPTCSKPSNSNQ